MAKNIYDLLRSWQRMDVAAWAEHVHGWVMPDGQPISLAPWQRAVLSAYWPRRAGVSTLLISTVKKAGKTLLDSLVLAHRWLTLPGLHFSVGNDRDQSAELQFNMVRDMCERHPILKRHVNVTRDVLTFAPTAARIVALPMDYRGASGANFITVSISELWAFDLEAARRLAEELTPIPGDCLRIIDSYAGFEGEDSTLRLFWDRGLAGDAVDAEWPITLTGQQLSYIHQGEGAQRRCWRGAEAGRRAYYAEQRATLREATYRRLHLNQWASAEDVFIGAEQWDALVDEGYVLPGPGHLGLYAGLDASTKHDRAAVVTVYPRDGKVYLGPYRIFQPPIDFDAVESYLAELHRAYHLAGALYDPYQLEYLAQRARSSGLPAVEWPQSIPRMTEAGNRLFDLVKQRRLVVYPGAGDLRAHVLAASAKETPRGIRLVKGEGGRVIDAAVALAMACTSVVESPPPASEMVYLDWRDLVSSEPTEAELVAEVLGRGPLWHRHGDRRRGGNRIYS